MTRIGAKKDRSLVARAEAALSELGGRATRKRKASPEETTLVCDVMSRRVAAIDAGAPVADAAKRLAERDVGVLAICRADDRLSGVITDRDIVVRVVAQGLDPDELTVGECGSGERNRLSARNPRRSGAADGGAASAPAPGDRRRPPDRDPQPHRPDCARRRSADRAAARAPGTARRRPALGSLAAGSALLGQPIADR